MSSIHSRSSSEVETTPYGEILPVFFKDLQKDFDFNDVKEKVRDLFEDNEYDYISKETGDAQIFHLLWTLQSKSDEFVLKFLDCISYEYKWIVDKIKEQLNDHNIVTTTYLERLKRTQMDNQKHTDFNVHRTKPFMQLRSALRKRNSKYGSSSVILLGELGSGKKWLALDVCSDFAVLKRMNFKIFWIDCVNCVTPQEDYNALKTFMIKLNPAHQFDDYNMSKIMIPFQITQLKEQIKRQLESKEFYNCLLVLANVQNSKCQESFNLGCKRLIITRNKKVSRNLSAKLNTHLTLDEGLNMTEFHLLLDKYVTSYNWRKETGNYASDIYHMSNGDPYMLSIIARNLQEKKSNWKEWKKHLDNLQIPDYKFIRDIENSLKLLTLDQLQLYATFAVFPYCARIPVKLLSTLWNMDLTQAEAIVNKLHENSFVKKEILEDNDTIVCSLKYVYSSYIKNMPEIQKLINPLELHRKIVEYYQVEENLNIRKDVDLYYGNQHDCYFFRCIGYHLYGAKYKRLFPKLYKDFGFLGQKLRTVGLANTIADLRDYETEILQGDTSGLLKKLIAFLAKIEEKIIHAPDCCLLQYALLAEEPVRDLALQQIEKFPQRIWFTDSGQFHQRRFIISLTKYAKLIRILECDICVVVLFNNDTFLVDISLDSICGPVQLIDAATADIIDIKTFNNNNHLLTLDSYGHLNLWKIEDEKRRMLAQRREPKSNFNPSNFKICPNKISSKPFKQSINDRVYSYQQILAFHLENPNSANCILHVALDNGNVVFFDWNSQFEEFEQQSYNIPLKTDISNIHSICKINTHLMIMDYGNDSSSMMVTFLNLRNTAKEYLNLDWPKHTALLYYEMYSENSIILVFTYTVVRLSLKFHPEFSGKLEVLYENRNCLINCAKLCLKNQYLILGTERGLLVYDIRQRLEILQSIVSENIRCVDNFDLDDEEFQTMIVCGIENRNILYLFGLRKTEDSGLVWEHSCLHNAMEKVTLEEQKNTRFLGQNLFDITKDDETLYAVDSKNRIHQICCSETKNWSIIPSPDVARRIIAISAYLNSVFIAFENGEIYDLHERRCVVKSSSANNSSTTMDYFKIVNDNTLIMSPSREMTCITQIDSDVKTYPPLPLLTKYCAMIFDNYLLVVNDYGAALIFDCENNFSYTIGIRPHHLLADCDLKDNVLFLGFSNYSVHIYTLEKTSNQIICHKTCELRQNGKDCTITCLTASPNAQLFAIGLNTGRTPPPPNNQISCGDIEIFKLDENFKEQLVYCLKSHANPIYDMMFSPQSDVLISVSEQICFWNINYILNNPLNVGSTKRHSSRFNSQKSTEEVDATPMCYTKQNKFLHLQPPALPSYGKMTNSFEQPECLDTLSDDNVFENIDSVADEENIWPYVRGPEDKPELLSCLKLDGNVAKQIFANKNFTQFFTIDDEGVYYNLKLIKPSQQISPDCVDIAVEYSSSSSDIPNDNHHHLYMHRLSIASSSTISGADVVDDAST